MLLMQNQENVETLYNIVTHSPYNLMQAYILHPNAMMQLNLHSIVLQNIMSPELRQQ